MTSVESKPAVPAIEVAPSVYDFAKNFEVDSLAIGEYLQGRGLSEEEIVSTSIRFLPKLGRTNLLTYTAGRYNNDGVAEVRTTPILPRLSRYMLNRGTNREEAELYFDDFNTYLSKRINGTVKHELEHRIQDRPDGTFPRLYREHKIRQLKTLAKGAYKPYVLSLGVIGAELAALHAARCP